MTILHSKQHTIQTTTFKKRALSACEDKRCWLSENESLPHEHVDSPVPIPKRRHLMLLARGDVVWMCYLFLASDNAFQNKSGYESVKECQSNMIKRQACFTPSFYPKRSQREHVLTEKAYMEDMRWETQGFFRYFPVHWEDNRSGPSPTPSPPTLEPMEWDYEWSKKQLTDAKTSGSVREQFCFIDIDSIKDDTSKRRISFQRVLLKYIKRPWSLEEETIANMLLACINNRLAELCRPPSIRVIYECNPYTSSEL